MSPSDPTARERLLDASVGLVLAGGPGALTGRGLTARLGASPSAVNYHFGGLAELARAVHVQIAGRQEAWRARRLEALAGGATGPAWAWVAAALTDLAFAAGRERLALLEFAHLAQDGDPALRRQAQQDHLRHAAFWRSGLERLGRTIGEAEIWAAAAHAATPLVLLEDDAVAAFGWLAPAMLRLEERLEGRASPGAIAWLAPAGQRPPGPVRAAGAQRLVDAALKVIAERGLHAATLRAVAQAAGLSLGSTTYFFRSKAEIVQAAFAQLRDAASRSALEAGLREGRAPSRRALPIEGAPMKTANAIEALMLAGARSPDLRGVALSLRSLTGETASQWLAARSPGRFDRLDGFLSSVVAQGLISEASLTQPDEPPEALEAQLAGALDRLFPP